jgi:hypothetical protein
MKEFNLWAMANMIRQAEVNPYYKTIVLFLYGRYRRSFEFPAADQCAEVHKRRKVTSCLNHAVFTIISVGPKTIFTRNFQITL